jgi:hypothetical protein
MLKQLDGFLPVKRPKNEARLQPLLLISLFLLINGLVLFNTLFHHPLVGYDAHDHAAYVLTLSAGRLPTLNDTSEFFSPPLPYLLPSLAYATGRVGLGAALKLGQLQNVFLSLATTYLVLRLCRRLDPARPWLPVLALLLLGVMTVYYKSFTFLRGEPWLVVFTLLLVDELNGLARNERLSSAAAVRSGLWLGFALLSRQWAFMLIPLFLLWTAAQSELFSIPRSSSAQQAWLKATKELATTWLISGAVVMLVAGWFYGHLYLSYGSVAAFNRVPYDTLSLQNHPSSFYLGMGNGKLFTDPVRPSFPAQLWPKFYSELWGDYEAYFLVYGIDQQSGQLLSGIRLEEALEDSSRQVLTNRYQIAGYLAWVNRLALGVTTILLLGFGSGAVAFWRWLRARPPVEGQPAVSPPTTTVVLYWLVIVLAVVGYAYFLMRYPSPGNGDTIKATYLLHTYPLLAILTARWLEWVRGRAPILFVVLGGLIVVALLCLLPTFISRYALPGLLLLQ